MLNISDTESFESFLVAHLTYAYPLGLIIKGSPFSK